MFSCECQETLKPINCFNMYFSNALPVQLWLAGQKSYNQRNENNFPVQQYCFNQKFKCAADIKWQLQELTQGLDYYLNTIDKDGNILNSTSFNKTDKIITTAIPVTLNFINTEFAANVSNWNVYDNPSGYVGANWIWAADIPENGIAKIDGVSSGNNYSKIFGGLRPTGINSDRGWPLGTYQVVVRAQSRRVTSSAATVSIYELDDDGNIVGTVLASSTAYPGTTSPSSGYHEGFLDFTLAHYAKQFGIQFSDGGIIKMDIAYINMDVAPAVDTTYIKSIYDLTTSLPAYCDSKIKFEVRRTGDDLLMAFSDYIQVTDTDLSSLLIKYRSPLPFDSIYYDASSDYFEFTVQGFLAREVNIKNVSVVELSNDAVVQTSVTIAKQRKMVIEDMPDYMHTKIEEALAHPDLIIIGDDEEVFNYIADSPYNREDRPDSYPLTAANTLLKRKNYLKRGVI